MPSTPQLQPHHICARSSKRSTPPTAPRVDLAPGVLWHFFALFTGHFPTYTYCFGACPHLSTALPAPDAVRIAAPVGANRRQRERGEDVTRMHIAPPADDLESAILLIEADRLDRFARAVVRYSRPELAELGDAVAEIPDAAALLAAQFIRADYDAALRADLAMRSNDLLTTAAATVTTSLQISRIHLRAGLILRRAAREHLRALSPRSPGLPALA